MISDNGVAIPDDMATVLTDDEVAVLLSYVRSAWGHQAAPLSTFEVNRYRTGASAGSY